MPAGVYQAQKTDGTTYYRVSITYKTKHISLGSFPDPNQASTAFQTANSILYSEKSIHEYDKKGKLSFEKWVSLCNFRDNLVYIKNPIYLHKNYFDYYFSPEHILKFDIDDLFYYSSHKISRRGTHLFVADYGMQCSIASRYGIRNYAVEGRDYRFVNGDSNDFRYENIEILNQYHGVSLHKKNNKIMYKTKIHIRSTYVVGYYDTETEAAIAYNKAVDELSKNGIRRQFSQNYLSDVPPSQYAEIYVNLLFSKSFYKLLHSLEQK